MANMDKLLPFIEKWEGGFVNDPQDLGGATNRGVTIGTWKTAGYDKDGDGDIDEDDVRQISREDMAECVLRPHYWNRCQADRIESQAIANIMVDWVWASGVTGIKQVQALLGVKVDGIVGEKTLQAINSAPQEDLFTRIKAARVDYVEQICNKRPANLHFRKGWLRRIEDIKWLPVLLLLLLPLASSCRSSANYKTSRTQENTSVQTAIASNTKLSEDVQQSTSSFTTLQTGESLEIEIIRFEYDTLSPQTVRSETRTRINRQTDVRQEQQQETDTEQQTTIIENKKVRQDVEQHIKTKERESEIKYDIKWWWYVILPCLIAAGLLWWWRKYFL